MRISEKQKYTTDVGQPSGKGDKRILFVKENFLFTMAKNRKQDKNEVIYLYSAVTPVVGNAADVNMQQIHQRRGCQHFQNYPTASFFIHYPVLAGGARKRPV